MSATLSPHGGPAPSAWVQRWSHLIAPGARVLDVACGSGRHVRWFAGRGCHVTALDRDAVATEALHPIADVVLADIEAGPWPLPERHFDAVVVTNYLWRPLLPTLCQALADGGVLIYETFAHGQQGVGRPANPDFLLRPGELLDAARSLRVVAFEDGFLGSPARFVQRIAAVNAGADAGGPGEIPRYLLDAGHPPQGE
jgi:SAM-dependent methyltransferase